MKVLSWIILIIFAIIIIFGIPFADLIGFSIYLVIPLLFGVIVYWLLIKNYNHTNSLKFVTGTATVIAVGSTTYMYMVNAAYRDMNDYFQNINSNNPVISSGIPTELAFLTGVAFLFIPLIVFLIQKYDKRAATGS